MAAQVYKVGGSLYYATPTGNVKIKDPQEYSDLVARGVVGTGQQVVSQLPPVSPDVSISQTYSTKLPQSDATNKTIRDALSGGFETTRPMEKEVAPIGIALSDIQDPVLRNSLLQNAALSRGKRVEDVISSAERLQDQILQNSFQPAVLLGGTPPPDLPKSYLPAWQAASKAAIDQNNFDNRMKSRPTGGGGGLNISLLKYLDEEQAKQLLEKKKQEFSDLIASTGENGVTGDDRYVNTEKIQQIRQAIVSTGIPELTQWFDTTYQPRNVLNPNDATARDLYNQNSWVYKPVSAQDKLKEQQAQSELDKITKSNQSKGLFGLGILGLEIWHSLFKID